MNGSHFLISSTEREMDENRREPEVCEIDAGREGMRPVLKLQFVCWFCSSYWRKHYTVQTDKSPMLERGGFRERKREGSLHF